MEREKGNSRQNLVQGRQQQFPRAALKLKLKTSLASFFHLLLKKKKSQWEQPTLARLYIIIICKSS